MSVSARKWLKWALFALCFGVLCLMVWLTGFENLYNNICAMRWMMLAVVAVWGVGYLLNASSWGLIISCYPMKERLPIWRLLQTTITGYAFNYITPMGLLGGEPYRVMVMKRYLGVEAATSSVLLYAIMHFCSHFIFWLLACVVALLTMSANDMISELVSVHYEAWALGITIVVCVLLLVLFYRCCKHGMVAATLRKLCKLPFVGARLTAWCRLHNELLSRIDEGVKLLLDKHPRRFFASLGVELASRLVCCLEIQLIVLQVFDINIGYANAYIVVAISSLFANLMFFSPLQMGTREGGILLALAYVAPAALTTTEGKVVPLMLFGIAMCTSFVTRIREFIWIGIGLLIGLFKK